MEQYFRWKAVYYCETDPLKWHNFLGNKFNNFSVKTTVTSVDEDLKEERMKN